MTTPNDASNPETSEKETSPRRSSRAKRNTSEGGLVKAGGSEVVFVLDDDTRLVETDSLPNHRPIALSSFEIVGTLDQAGHRPIGANTFMISTLDTLPGHRPVGVSSLMISDLHTLPGDRPIAPNDVIDPHPSVLMGYLD
ncbi:hypothetical protein [Phormidium sp. FACHB-1136]|jgi:hypothetical protein|uniref:hypothetical protein n=1 Tax=Phormidium sp. FACHB-1136 TaxID=2692848 RepID=UPI00168529EE|nr:hypothetical protein [Phormidium sp. FACHB-1136]MBD2425033.1 hypothetical protein [Phormidium sp. FACHB-1136]